MKAKPYQYGATPLCGIEKVATWQRQTAPGASLPIVVIHERCSMEDGAYYPPSSITIFSASSMALRGAIDEALKDGESPDA